MDKAKLHEALILMSSKPLRKEYRSKWSKEQPTIGYCVIVSLLVLHYCAPKGSKLFYVKLNNL